MPKTSNAFNEEEYDDGSDSILANLVKAEEEAANQQRKRAGAQSYKNAVTSSEQEYNRSIEDDGDAMIAQLGGDDTLETFEHDSPKNNQAIAFNESSEEYQKKNGQTNTKEEKKKEKEDILNIKENSNQQDDGEESIADEQKKKEEKVKEQNKEVAQEKEAPRQVATEKKLDRESLLKMTGMNYKAQDQKAFNEARAKREQAEKSSKFDSLAERGNIAFNTGDVLEQVQVLKEMERLGVKEAGTKLRKLDDDDNFVNKYNEAANIESKGIRQQAAAAAAQKEQREADRKIADDNRKFDLDKRKQDFAENQAKDAKAEREAEKKSKAETDKIDKELKAENEKYSREWQKKVFEKKYGERDEDDMERLYLAADDAKGEIYDNALKRTLADSWSRLGVNGFIKNIAGDRGVEEFAVAIENNARTDKMSRQKVLDQRTNAQGLPRIEIDSLNVDKLRDDLKMLGPKEIDKLRAYKDDIGGAMKYLALLVPSVRAGAGFAMGAGLNQQGQESQPAPAGRRGFPPTRSYGNETD